MGTESSVYKSELTGFAVSLKEPVHELIKRMPYEIVTPEDRIYIRRSGIFPVGLCDLFQTTHSPARIAKATHTGSRSRDAELIRPSLPSPSEPRSFRRGIEAQSSDHPQASALQSWRS